MYFFCCRVCQIKQRNQSFYLDTDCVWTGDSCSRWTGYGRCHQYVRSTHRFEPRTTIGMCTGVRNNVFIVNGEWRWTCCRSSFFFFSARWIWPAELLLKLLPMFIAWECWVISWLDDLLPLSEFTCPAASVTTRTCSPLKKDFNVNEWRAAIN